MEQKKTEKGLFEEKKSQEAEHFLFFLKLENLGFWGFIFNTLHESK